MEHLEWLELSSPPAPVAKKPFAGEATPCPSCGWPVAPDADVCAQCGHGLTEQVATTLLSDLKIELPEPVIEVTSAPSHWFDGSALDSSPAMYNLRLQAEQLRVTTGFDRLICLDDISVEHYAHQLEAAQRALRDMRGRALLADEVGLGKTIEAGIVMKELIERGLVQSVLIVVPAPLTWQWHEEMQTKFHEEFVVLEDLDQLPPVDLEENKSKIQNGLYGPLRLKSKITRWLISLNRAKSDRWAERLLAREYDLLVVDEAHKLKNHQTDAYRFINGIRKRYVLMLTATPVHNDLIELYNLITILRPGHLGTRRAFRQNFVTTVTVQSHPEPKLEPTPSLIQSRPGHRTIYSSDSPPSYLRRSKEARQKYRQRMANTRWLLNRTENFTDLDTLTYLDRQGQKAVAEVRQLIAQGYEVVDFEAIEWKYGYRQRKLRHDFVCRLKLKPQPRRPRPRQPRVERRTTPRNPAALRGLLQEIMIRHRRSSVGLRFPPRRAAVYYLNLTPPERELYDGVSTYIREQLQQQAKAKAEGPKATGLMRMTLMTLQKELCSSPQAVAQTLDKLVVRQADPRLAEYLALARSIEHGRKVDATQIILSQYPDKFLIFTDYLPTLHALRAALDQAGHETVIFHGGMSTYERVEAIRTFRKSPSARVMISTQSGGEGHNLQFCYQLINYDLPWNPMRIEQRIGRLQRLGQKQEVAIFNLSATQTIEAYVLELLAKKIRMFELVIGELDLILGELGDERGFEDYIEEAWAGSKSEAELLQMIAELEAVLGQAQTTYEQIRAVSDELSDVIDTRV